jgi:NAD(P)-dependent dehydrogenase (short-subunit alcohol dehydrogenase family)
MPPEDGVDPMPQTVIITGASSGIGRATARLLAERGDPVVLAARRQDALDEAARACGPDARTLVVPVDVTDPDAVDGLAERAIAEFGRIDAWVHLAAVGAFGHFWDIPNRVFQRLIEVNLTGSVYVTKAALRVFQQQGQGTLVLISSTDAAAPIPHLNVYDATKAGVAQLVASVRADLENAGWDKIHVVDVRPPTTDTPFYTHAANYVGRVARAPPPAYAPETVAKAILQVMDDPKAMVSVGLMSKFQRVFSHAAPAVYEKVIGTFSDQLFTDEARAVGEGNVFAPVRAGRAERQEQRTP